MGAAFTLLRAIWVLAIDIIDVLVAFAAAIALIALFSDELGFTTIGGAWLPPYRIVAVAAFYGALRASLTALERRYLLPRLKSKDERR